MILFYSNRVKTSNLARMHLFPADFDEHALIQLLFSSSFSFSVFLLIHMEIFHSDYSIRRHEFERFYSSSKMTYQNTSSLVHSLPRSANCILSEESTSLSSDIYIYICRKREGRSTLLHSVMERRRDTRPET